MLALKTTLVARGSFQGKHRWPEAPESYKELQRLHQHDFGFEVAIRVVLDRQIEFLALRDAIAKSLRQYLQGHLSSSCETLATELFLWLTKATWKLPNGRYGPFDVLWVEVNEDGQCGARVEGES